MIGYGCRFVRGLLPLRLAHLEELFSDSVLWQVAELMEDCQKLWRRTETRTHLIPGLRQKAYCLTHITSQSTWVLFRIRTE